MEEGCWVREFEPSVYELRGSRRPGMELPDKPKESAAACMGLYQETGSCMPAEVLVPVPVPRGVSC